MRRYLSAFALLTALLVSHAFAKYDGADPARCKVCEQPCPTCSNNTDISPSEGNLRQGFNYPGLQSAFGGTLRLSLAYNSYNADGSRSTIDTVLGYGWTHSLNTFLFSQRANMFRMGEDGRITKYGLGPGGTFTAAPGYFETLVHNGDGSFSLTTKYKTVYRFESVPGTPFLVDGPVYRLTKITDRNNNITTLTYSGGNLIQATDTYGRSLTFTYNSSHKLASATDPLGRITTFAYDATGHQLLSVTDALGHATRFSYNVQFQMAQKIDRDGRVFTYQYSNGVPTGVTDGLGQPLYNVSNPTNWAYDANALAANLTRVYVPSTTTKTDGLGQQWKYTYDSNGFIVSVQAPDGATTSYSYDPTTLQVSSVTDANGNQAQYQYDSMGNMTRRTDALGHITTYTYEPVFNMMTSVTDPQGRATTYSYDARGNRTGEVDPLLQTRSWTYDSHGNILSDTDKRGNTTTYLYDANGNRTQSTDPLANVIKSTYDTVGNVLTYTDANGHMITYAYDGLNRVAQQTDALSGVTRYAYDNEGNRTQVTDPNNHTTTYQYDQRNRQTKVTDALGGNITSSYDANDNRISLTDQNSHTTLYQYDAQNRRKQITDAAANTTKVIYDGVGNLISRTDGNNHTSTYTYDALNRRSTITDAAAETTTFVYDITGLAGCPQCTGPTLGSNTITKQIDANGKVIYTKYDGLDRLIIQNRKVGGTADVITPGDAVTRYGYDPNSNNTSLTEPDGNVTTYVYDALNRRTQTTNAAGDVTANTYDGVGNLLTQTSPNGNLTTYAYDPLNRMVSVIDSVGPRASYTYDAASNRLTEADGLSKTTTYGYDALNRIVTDGDAKGQTTSYTYDPVGNRLQATDREGRVTTYAYDAINRRISTTDANGDTTSYQYDGVGNLTRVTDARGNQTNYVYDSVNRLSLEQYPGPLPNTRSYGYDGVGNRTSRTDQNGHTTTYSYNDLYFLTSRNYPISAADNFTYDLSGRMLSASKGGWADSFTYDGADRILASVQNGQTLSYFYNIPGRIRRLTYPGGRVITESTDPRSRLAQSNDGGAPAIVAYTYDAADNVVSRTYRNGVVATYAYDANNWTTSLDHKLGATRIVGFAYDRDKEGNAKDEQKRHVTTLSEAYAYDSTYRLVNYAVGTLVGSTVPVPSTQTQYNLDQVGNWTTKTTNGVPQNRTHNAVNEVTAIDATTLLYDANGNLTDDGTQLYFYDEENRLITVKRKSDGATMGQYQYDAIGRRVRTIDSLSVETWYYYDAWRTVEEQNAGAVTVATYVFGRYVDEVATMDRGGQSYYYHQNDNWETHGLTNSAGLLVEGYTYDAYGQQTTYLPGPDGTVDFGGDDVVTVGGASFYGNPFLFTGQRFDFESGLYYYKERAYSVTLGRFLQRDPIAVGFAGFDQAYQSTNLYEYVEGSPANLVDPYGEAPKDCAKATRSKKVVVQSGDVDHMNQPNSIGEQGTNFGHVSNKINSQLGECDCIQTLVLSAHAYPDGFDIRGRKPKEPRPKKGKKKRGEEEWSGPNAVPAAIVEGNNPREFTEIQEGNAARFIGVIRESACFCKPCTIWMLGCNIGLGKVPQAIANASGCEVKAPLGFVVSNVDDPGASRIIKTHDGKTYDGAKEEFGTFTKKD